MSDKQNFNGVNSPAFEQQFNGGEFLTWFKKYKDFLFGDDLCVIDIASFAYNAAANTRTPSPAVARVVKAARNVCISDIEDTTVQVLWEAIQALDRQGEK